MRQGRDSVLSDLQVRVIQSIIFPYVECILEARNGIYSPLYAAVYIACMPSFRMLGC